jgi:glycine hydroxymethyltransferase
VTRLGMGEAEMEAIGDFIVRIVSGQDRPEAIVNDVVEFRAPFQTLYYCFENGFPQRGNRDRSRSGKPTIT